MTTNESDPGKDFNDAVADTLNGERVASGMTFDELAKATGVSKRQLMRLLSTKERHLNVAVIAVIAEQFHISPAQVFARAEERMGRGPRLDTQAFG